MKRNCNLTLTQPKRFVVLTDGDTNYSLDAGTCFWMVPCLPTLICHFGIPITFGSMLKLYSMVHLGQAVCALPYTECVCVSAVFGAVLKYFAVVGTSPLLTRNARFALQW